MTPVETDAAVDTDRVAVAVGTGTYDVSGLVMEVVAAAFLQVLALHHPHNLPPLICSKCR